VPAVRALFLFAWSRIHDYVAITFARAWAMSAYGPKQTSLVALHMSAFGGKADIDPRDDNIR